MDIKYFFYSTLSLLLSLSLLDSPLVCSDVRLFCFALALAVHFSAVHSHFIVWARDICLLCKILQEFLYMYVLALEVLFAF